MGKYFNLYKYRNGKVLNKNSFITISVMSLLSVDNMKGLRKLLQSHGFRRISKNLFPKGPDKCKDGEKCENVFNFSGYNYKNKSEGLLLTVKKYFNDLYVTLKLLNDNHYYTAHARFNSKEPEYLIGEMPEEQKNIVLSLFEDVNKYKSNRNL